MDMIHEKGGAIEIAAGAGRDVKVCGCRPFAASQYEFIYLEALQKEFYKLNIAETKIKKNFINLQ